MQQDGLCCCHRCAYLPVMLKTTNLEVPLLGYDVAALLRQLETAECLL